MAKIVMIVACLGFLLSLCQAATRRQTARRRRPRRRRPQTVNGRPNRAANSPRLRSADPSWMKRAPVPNVKVVAPPQKSGPDLTAVTDAAGNFTLRLPSWRLEFLLLAKDSEGGRLGFLHYVPSKSSPAPDAHRVAHGASDLSHRGGRQGTTGCRREGWRRFPVPPRADGHNKRCRPKVGPTDDRRRGESRPSRSSRHAIGLRLCRQSGRRLRLHPLPQAKREAEADRLRKAGAGRQPANQIRARGRSQDASAPCR